MDPFVFTSSCEFPTHFGWLVYYYIFRGRWGLRMGPWWSRSTRSTLYTKSKGTSNNKGFVWWQNCIYSVWRLLFCCCFGYVPNYLFTLDTIWCHDRRLKANCDNMILNFFNLIASSLIYLHFLLLNMKQGKIRGTHIKFKRYPFYPLLK